jgi:hypothetical protein
MTPIILRKRILRTRSGYDSTWRRSAICVSVQLVARARVHTFLRRRRRRDRRDAANSIVGHGVARRRSVHSSNPPSVLANGAHRRVRGFRIGDRFGDQTLSRVAIAADTADSLRLLAHRVTSLLFAIRVASSLSGRAMSAPDGFNSRYPLQAPTDPTGSVCAFLQQSAGAILGSETTSGGCPVPAGVPLRSGIGSARLTMSTVFASVMASTWT